MILQVPKTSKQSREVLVNTFKFLLINPQIQSYVQIFIYFFLRKRFIISKGYVTPPKFKNPKSFLLNPKYTSHFSGPSRLLSTMRALELFSKLHDQGYLRSSESLSLQCQKLPFKWQDHVFSSLSTRLVPNNCVQSTQKTLNGSQMTTNASYQNVAYFAYYL